LRARRLRLTGMVVLATGAIVAALFYWIRLRTAEPQLDELVAAGYLRAQERQARMMMGPMGVTLSQWADALTYPGTQAILIVAFAAFIAYMCFRHAKFADESS
jgi:hypothetical protein